MSYRSFWQTIRETVYDFVAGIFRTQAEIDADVVTRLSAQGTVVSGSNPLPAMAKSRPRLFYDPNDAIKYVTDAGIPLSYVYFVIYDSGGTDGDTYYRVYIEEA